MDIVGGVRLADGSEAKIVSGVDDHSRFCISALVVARATARPTCDALALAMRRHGVPAEILTDNGKVFTGRFGPGTGEVLFDRICRENGIKHLLTAPRSPTTTGKVERWHKTLRGEFLDRQGLRLDRRRAGPARCVGRALQPRPAASVARDGRAVGPVPARPSRTSRPAIETRRGSCRGDAGVSDATGHREGHDQLRLGALQGRRVARRSDRRGRLRRRARADPPPRRAHRDPRPPARPSQAGRRR